MNSIILSLGTYRGLLVDLSKRKFVSKSLSELSEILHNECKPDDPVERVMRRKKTVITSITYEVNERTSLKTLSSIAQMIDLLHLPYATVMVRGVIPSIEKILKEVVNLNHILIEVLISGTQEERIKNLTDDSSKINVFNFEVDKILDARDQGIHSYSVFLEKVSRSQLQITPEKLVNGVSFDPDQGHLHLKITDEIYASFGPFGSPHKNDWVKLSMDDQLNSKTQIDDLFRKTQTPLYFCHKCELQPLCTNSFVNRIGDLPSKLNPINCQYNMETGEFT